MPEVYVTLFDSGFLPQGLALYRSLALHCHDFNLWVVCLDQPCFLFLTSLQLDHLHLLNLSDLENHELLQVKADRSRAEYCWTLTPWSIQWVLDAEPTARRVTYVDADTYFLKSPIDIFSEFESSKKSFLITEHGYSPRYDQTSSSGRFCVQFVPVQRGNGQIVLNWWRERCLEWCYARFENGLFGDQKYFELIAELFEKDVHVIKGDGRFLAPWNADLFRFSDAVLYHFHGFRVISPGYFYLTSYKVPRPVLDFIYYPYSKTIRAAFQDYPELSSIFRPQLNLTFPIRFKLYLGSINAFLYDCFTRIPFVRTLSL